MLSISPSAGVGFVLFILSKKIMPGSPPSHASLTISLKTSLAFLEPVFLRSLGVSISYSVPFLTLFINSSVIPTERLKLVNFVLSCLAYINSIISGWSTRSIPILAPRRIPPCLIVSVAASNTDIKETGPEDTPFVVFTVSSFGRSLEKENPVPPPDL